MLNNDLVAPQPTDAEPPMLSGLHIVPCSIGCYYPPQVEGEDLLEVDWDVKSLRHDGLYLVESVAEKWRGCRRFQVMPSGWWMDQSGEQEWQHIQSIEAIGLRIVGYVREVYKPSRRIHEIVARTVMASAKTLAKHH